MRDNLLELVIGSVIFVSAGGATNYYTGRELVHASPVIKEINEIKEIRRTGRRADLSLEQTLIDRYHFLNNISYIPIGLGLMGLGLVYPFSYTRKED